LNPANEPGRLTLIHRFGANMISRRLPACAVRGGRAALVAIRCTGIRR
jgi:3-deoxy-D-arabino-heptulosonate 7-phosphate (DAHP) synthase class II